MTEFDTIIRGGTVIDGTRGPRKVTDVGIVDGTIARIGRLRNATADTTIDATGLIVAPGFVDTHTHYDAALFWDPYCTLSGWHGVTTVVIGNCGFGFAPAEEEDREYLMRSLTRVEAIPYEAIKASLPWTWRTFPEWLDQLDRQDKGVNIVASVPLNPLLTQVLGVDDAKSRDATEAELRQLEQVLREAMEAGAAGWSAQHNEPGSGNDTQRDFDGTPFSTDLMSLSTACRLADVVGDYPGGFIQVTWFSKDGLDKTQRDVEELAMAAQSPVIWNAIATSGLHPDIHRELTAWATSCANRGIPMYPQVVMSGASFFFTFEDWNMFDDSPTWREATIGSVEERLAKFKDPSRRAGLRDHPPARGIERTTILRSFSPKFERINNMLLPDAARILGYDNMIDCLIDIIVEDELRTKLQIPELNEIPELQAELVSVPYGLWGVSDGGAHTKFLTTGSYPTECLVKFTRDQDLISLEDAHWHLSALPAAGAGLRDRGILAEGCAADIVIYDHDTLQLQPEEVSYDVPAGEWRRICKPKGYAYILVNGDVTFQDGECTDALPGQLLRRGQRRTSR